MDAAACKMIALHKEVTLLEEHLRETMHDVVSLSLKVNAAPANKKSGPSKVNHSSGNKKLARLIELTR